MKNYYINCSILINSLLREADDLIICPDESIFRTTWNKNQCSIVLPENQFLSDAPELTIRPRCTYEVHVFANPRINLNSNAIKVY